MKRTIQIFIFLIFFLLSSSSYGELKNLKATWTANTDGVTIGYKLYRMDQGKNLIATIPGIETNFYDFQIDATPPILLIFIMTAYDSNGNESDYSDLGTFIWGDSIIYHHDIIVK